MQTEKEILNTNTNTYTNIAIFGDTNVGKCSLAKALSIASGDISKPNNFTYNNKNYYILPIACASLDYIEKYELSSTMCDIALIINEYPENVDDINIFTSNVVCDLVRKNVQNLIFCFNKIDKLEKIEENFQLIVNSYEKLIFQDEFFKFYNMNKINTRHYISISATENINIKSITDEENHNHNLNPKSLLDIIDSIKMGNESDERGVCFLVYDFYKDEENKHFVISGKNIKGVIEINKEYFLLPNKIKLNVDKISNCESYIEKAEENQFLTVRYNSNS
jgi:sulfate adenylyltransferase subunit 1 (EFTu-like GTPase family)